MSDQDCSDTEDLVHEPYSDHDLPGLRKRFIVETNVQDNGSEESVTENIESDDSKPETEITQQEFVTNNKIFTVSDEIILSSGFLHIPIYDKHIQKLLQVEKISFKYSEFLDIHRCLMGCATAPHSRYQLINIGKVVQAIEFHLSKINLMCDYYLRSNIDDNGWVRCDFIYHYLQFAHMNVTYDVFKTGLMHSSNVSLNLSGTSIRVNDFTELEENNHNSTHPQIFKLVSLIPKCGYIIADEVRYNLTVRGCHQKMAKAFNNQMNLKLSGKVSDVSKYYIHHIPQMNQFDKYLEYL